MSNKQTYSLIKKQNYGNRCLYPIKTKWQECFDESRGYPYYWHMETNEVTWELPEELKFQKSIFKAEHSSHNRNINITKTYPQIQNDIPEGMIPKAVVARNRNRNVRNDEKTCIKNEEVVKNETPSSNDEDSDDGPIEMITSIGNDYNTSDDTSDEEVKVPVKKSCNENKIKRIPKDKSLPIGPFLPTHMQPMSSKLVNINSRLLNNYADTNNKDVNAKLFFEEESVLSKVTENHSNENEMQSKIQVANSKATELKKKDQEIIKVKVSLVPGYEDDSDIEEETSENESPQANVTSDMNLSDDDKETCLTVSESEIPCNNNMVKKIKTRQTDNGCIRIFEYHVQKNNSVDKDKSDIKNDDTNEVSFKNEAEITLESHDVKINKFLDQCDAPAKVFQRKKRIAFDVIQNKLKSEFQEDREPTIASSSTCETNEENESKIQPNAQLSSTTQNESLNLLSKNTVNFVKGETLNLNKDEPNESLSESTEEFKTLINLTIEKLKFLSEGSPPATAVQIMTIQLQTLLSAWESEDLNKIYLCHWLTETNRELSRLEQTAAPIGWECQWDRLHKRYFYRNTSNGEMQWSYPETDIAGGTEEMELCTTPPPGQEEIENHQDEIKVTNSEVQSKSLLVPPPPQISSPSPPPPPRICAEDLKQGKKRKDEQEVYTIKKESLSEDASNVQTKQSKLSKKQKLDDSSNTVTLLTNEPLPPGVDSTDMAYSLSTPNIPSTVLYNPASQQTNPIYAATLGNAAVPLLAHHTALIQGQLMHYSPYHSLQNPMILPTANRLGEQEAIQFMVADYSRLYDNNQVITKPPIKTLQQESISSAIDNFYNDIASIEQSNKAENEAEKKNVPEIVPFSGVQVQQSDVEKSPTPHELLNVKEKKKKKSKPGTSKKQKEVSSMVAKWQKVQQNL